MAEVQDERTRGLGGRTRLDNIGAFGRGTSDAIRLYLATGYLVLGRQMQSLGRDLQG